MEQQHLYKTQDFPQIGLKLPIRNIISVQWSCKCTQFTFKEH